MKYIFKKIVIPDFNLQDILSHATKVQPLKAAKKEFEAAKEAMLCLRHDQNIFIRDNSENL